MAYPVPGMCIVANSAFEAYRDPDLIPEHDYERNDPLNPPINVAVGTVISVISVMDQLIHISLWGDQKHAWVWASQDSIQRNTVPETAIVDGDWAWLSEYRILHNADPENIWAPRTLLDRLCECFEDQ